jgi:hypothetical protein
MNAVKAILDQRIDVAIGYGKNAAAAAAIAAVRAATRDEFLAPETRDAVPAFSGVDFDVGFVDKFHIQTILATATQRKSKITAAAPRDQSIFWRDGAQIH